MGKSEKYNKEIVGIIIALFGMLAAISLFSNKTGIIGFFLRKTFFTLFGFGAYIFPIFIVALGLLLIINKLKFNKYDKSVYLLIIFLTFITLIHIKSYSISGFSEHINNALDLSKKGLGGGIIGATLGYISLKLFGSIGSYIIFSSIIFVAIILFTEVKIVDVFKRSMQNIIKLSDKEKQTISNSEKSFQKKRLKNNSNRNEEEEIIIRDYVKDEETTKTDSREYKVKTQQQHIPFDYQFPEINMLDNIEKNDVKNRKEILNNAKKIETTMKSFGIDATITQINKGPTITCYELQPAPGVKVSKIVNLSDDLALNLATSDIRIEAPMPGKSVVGIEVPNKIKDSVGLKELLESKEFQTLDSKLPLVLGKDISGKPIISSIDKMPHLLIAGATGSGKSVCINTIIMSILFKAFPHEVKLLLIDPKVVELSIYNGIPHLLIPVVTKPKKAASALGWAVEEMEKRYKLFAKNNVRDIDSYNKFIDTPDNKLPKILIIIDELSDLMMVAAQEIEDYICRLAQMARAAGIYLIIATQRPSVDVITGIIKANIPSRISFQVSSQIDSRTILDISGAEKLLGKGDMLFFPSNNSRPTRVQGAFVSDREVGKVVDYLKNQNITEYSSSIVDSIEEGGIKTSLDNETDELLFEAINLVVEEGQASISLLQRRLRIGYARAARIVDEMEDRGIIGGFQGSKPREVLINKEDLDTILRSENL